MKFKKGDIIYSDTGYFRKVLAIIDDTVYVVSTRWEINDDLKNIKECRMSSGAFLTEWDVRNFTLVEREKEVWVPRKGDSYYCADLASDELFALYDWVDSPTENLWLKRNLVFKTQEEAVARAKEMLGIKE